MGDAERAQRKALIADYQEKLAAENKTKLTERNARRWKQERDPAEYERQKERQRQEYSDSKGGDVRRYERIEGKTRAEHEANAKARHADLEKDRYANLSPEARQAKSDGVADAAFEKRLRNKGKNDEEIQLALQARLTDRKAKREAMRNEEKERAITYGNNPNFGIF